LGEQLREAQKMEAIGRLTGGLAHDLNNYLAVIMGNLDLLTDVTDAGSEASKLIEAAIGGALRGAELTRSLLAFSRRQPLDSRVIDVGARIANVTAMLKRTIGENIAIELHAAEGLWPVKIDGAQLDTCVVNLANNARDAMPNGGKWSIALSNVSAQDADPAAAGPPPGDHVLIEFTDTGMGMSQTTLTRIFEPFFTTKGPGHGTGLGLSMAHGFVHQSHGTIRVTSRPGEGTSVCIYLPRALEAVAVAPVQPKAAPLPGGHERILLVEDNEHVRATASDQLGSLGYVVVAAESGDAALALLEKNPSGFDLLFSDVMMPGQIDGFELARIALERWPQMPTLMASGFAGGAGPALEDKESERGFTVLRKPYRKAELARAVRSKLVGSG
jgi:CheY-like chemotaxis protein